MMQVNQNEIWALELSDYFMKKYKYQLMTVNKDTKELWLFNADNKAYPIIMISTERTDDFKKEELLIYRASLASLLQVENKGLNISVNKESSELDSLNVLISEGNLSDPSILNEFKNIDQVLKSSTNLKSSLNRVSMNMQKSMRKVQKYRMFQDTKVTMILSTILAIVFGLTYYMTIAKNQSAAEVLVKLGAYYKPFIVFKNEWWRLITPMFLHADFLHLFMNTFALRNLGSVLEKEMGSLKFLVVLVSGVIFGNLFVFIRGEAIIGVGISAGIYALMGALIVILYEKDLLKNKTILSNVIMTITINLVISFLPNISMTAHLGGLYIGVLSAFALSDRKDFKSVKYASIGFIIISVLALAVLSMQNMYIGV